MKRFDIYIDGSHLDKQNNGRLGIGGVLVDLSGPGMGKLVNEFSIELIPEYMKLTFGADKCSNPSAELTALLISLQKFKKLYGTSDIVVVHADYIGVKSWMEGSWKIKEPYIARIKNDIDEEINKQGLRGRISYEWVKGHQSSNAIKTNPDAFWNNYVDQLAKGEK
jgi:ribonuclease HI